MLPVYVVLAMYPDDTYIEAVYMTLESAQAMYPGVTWTYHDEHESGREHWTANLSHLTIELHTVNP
jgi:hypothetical protein